MSAVSSVPTLALAAFNTSGCVHKHIIQRNLPRENEVMINIQYCGICHSDLHELRAEWPKESYYPMVPGHEIVGIVDQVGSNVTKFAPGDRVGVGCLVNSCGECNECKDGYEQFCNQATFTYGSKTTNDASREEFEYTFGGYSQRITVSEDFVLKVPDNLPLEAAAPLLCAGITMFSPLRHWGAGESRRRVGILGIGGLGHMGVKIALAMGAEVTGISSSSKKKEYVESLGASFVSMSSAEDMAAAAGSLDLIVDTASAAHDINAVLSLLSRDGQLVMVGVPSDPLAVHAFSLIMRRKSVSGSLIGGIPETQEMLNFCAEHNIVPDVDLIEAKDVNHALVQLATQSSSKSRFVIRIAETLREGDWEVEQEAVDPSSWKVHAHVVPESANVHDRS